MTAAARTLPTPKSRSMSRRVSRARSSCSSWLMASGMARSHRGFAGTVQVLSASRGTGRLAAAWTVRTGDVGRDPPCDAPVAPPDRLCGRLDGGAGCGGSGAGGLRLDAGGGRGRGELDGHGARGGAARVPKVAASASTSAGRAPDRPGRPAELRAARGRRGRHGPFPRSGGRGRRRPSRPPPRPAVFPSGSSARLTGARRRRGSPGVRPPNGPAAAADLAGSGESGTATRKTTHRAATRSFHEGPHASPAGSGGGMASV